MGSHKFPGWFSWAALLLAAAAYAGLLFSGVLADLGLSLRYDFTTVVLPLVVVLYVCLRLPGRTGRLAGAMVFLLLFGLVLVGLWGSALSEPGSLGGLLPFSDASGYYTDARRLLNGSLFSAFSSRRPLFAGLLAALLGLTGQNLQVTLALLVAFNALGCLLAVREVQRTHGEIAAALSALLLFLFYRAFIGSTLTENLGLALGTSGFALLWRGASQRRGGLIAAGLLVVTLGLNSRAGPFFVLPLLVLWLGFFLTGAAGARRFSVRWAGIGAAAVVLGFLLNTLLFRAVAAPGGMAFSNFSYTLYGLTVGGEGWTQVKRDHPEVMALAEPQRSQRIYELAWQAFQDRPQGLALGALRSWGDFFSARRSSAFSFVGGKNVSANTVARLALFALGALGIWGAYRARKEPFAGLLLAAWLGILISVPFVPPADSALMRTYAAVMPFFAILPGLGAAWLVGWLPRGRFLQPQQDLGSAWGAAALAGLLTLLAFGGPLVVRAAARPVLAPAFTCPAGQQALPVRWQPGAAIRILANETIARSYLPDLRWGKFNQGLHDFMYTDVMVELESQTQPPALLTHVLRLDTNDAVWLVVRSDQMPQPGAVTACGQPSSNPQAEDFFFADAVYPPGGER